MSGIWTSPCHEEPISVGDDDNESSRYHGKSRCARQGDLHTPGSEVWVEGKVFVRV